MKHCLLFTLVTIALLPLSGPAQASRIEAGEPVVLSPQEAVKQGRELVAQLLQRQPEPVTNSGVLRIRDRDRRERELTVLLSIRPSASETVSTYEARDERSGALFRLDIVYNPSTSNSYFLTTKTNTASEPVKRHLSPEQTMVPFADSDFWVADLGLEFLRWPIQMLVRKEMRRGQATSVLECVNPKPTGQQYSRVLSWVDTDTGGIVHADAYDASGKLLKQFSPTHFQRIEGQYQVRQIEMRNRQTGSRSLLEFNLK